MLRLIISHRRIGIDRESVAVRYRDRVSKRTEPANESKTTAQVSWGGRDGAVAAEPTVGPGP